MSSNEKSYKLTVKGFLSVRTGMLGDFDAVWDELTEFVMAQAKENGMTDGVPCLVLVDGGHCITAETGKEPVGTKH